MTRTDKLPAAPEAEKQVVGSILLLPEVSADVGRLISAWDFLDPANRAIYVAIEKLRTAGHPIEPAMIVGELRDCQAFVGSSPAGYLLEISQQVVTAAHAAHYAKVMREESRKRRLAALGESVRDAAMNGQSSDTVFNDLAASVDDWRKETTTIEPKYRAIGSVELAAAKYDLLQIVDRVLYANQPAILGGPKKALKTSLAVDLGLSVATGGFFLRKFPVINRRRVLLCSGESGLAVLQETAFRVCRAMGIELAEVHGLVICDALPRVWDAIDLREFEHFVVDNEPGVVIMDPLYRMLNGDGEASIFKMGGALGELCDVCLTNGATPVICHHMKTSRLNQYAPAELDDLAFAGCAEYFRQWLLLSRREQYQPGTGEHRLWLTIGGSAGHNSLSAVDVSEGSIDDVGGRHWAVEVTKADAARDAEQQRKTNSIAVKAQQQLDEDRAAVCRVLAKHPGGMSKTAIGERAAISGRRWPKVFTTMLDDGELAPCQINVSNKKQPIEGYKLNQSEPT